MIPNIVFLILICSGSFYCAARYQRGFEEALPITSLAMIFLVFIFGVFGHLLVGIYAIILLSVLLYLLSIFHLIHNKNFRTFFSACITPGSIVFFIFFFAVSYLNVEKLASSWDEFSHWVDITKVMVTLDDFGTNAKSNSMFQSYPPGMSIFQYILQKITIWFNPANIFSEWRIYVAYQTLCILPFIPIFKICSFRKPFHLLLTGSIILFTPLIFFNDLYNSVYIDPFLGLVSGAGFMLILLHTTKDWMYHTLIYSYCMILVLSKDVGIVFAIFLLLAYTIDVFELKKLNVEIGSIRKKLLLCLGAILSCALPKMLWKIELSSSNAVIIFSNKIDFRTLVNVLLGNDTSYRTTVLENYVYSQFDKGIYLGHSSIHIPYFILFLLVVLLLVLFLKAYITYESQKLSSAKAVFPVVMFQLLVYIVGMCVIYISKFTEYEAVNLASLSRYLNIVYLSAWIVIAVSVCYATKAWISSTTLEICALCIALSISPVSHIVRFVDKSNIEASISVREKYQPLQNTIHRFCDGNDRIYFISQDDSGFDYWVSKFNARPNSFNPNWTWAIGKTDYADGMYTIVKSATEWKQELLSEYDYVALYKLNQYFIDHYSALFESPDDIAVNCLYYIDKDSGLLVKCK